MVDHDRRRLNSWLDVVGELLRQPLTGFPLAEVVHQFAATFEARPSWTWMNSDGGWGFDSSHAPADWPSPDEMEYWDREGIRRHPLVRWFTTTGSHRAQTLGRVPLTLAGRRDREMVTSQLRPVGLDEQLSIPYHLSGWEYRTFVLARTGADFPDEDVRLAQSLQPLLALLDRQVQVLARAPVDPMTLHASGLTIRELAVLRLLAEGHTATAMAHRLGSSPRTVSKHLEHIYRKLGAHDRLTAVRVAQAQGLMAPMLEPVRPAPPTEGSAPQSLHLITGRAVLSEP